MVVNHGVLSPMTRLADASVQDWKYLYEINFFSGLALVLGKAPPAFHNQTNMPQLKAAIPELRKTKGAIIWISSGAATKAYAAWGAYGSSKAAMNSLSEHVAVEEPDITSICISPGRVDTDMQSVLRTQGAGVMKESDHASFVSAYEGGELFKPEQPGGVIAKLVLDPKPSLSGKFFKYGPQNDSVQLCFADAVQISSPGACGISRCEDDGNLRYYSWQASATA